MDIQKYTDWFHDGTLKKITHEPKQKRLVLEMGSSEIGDWDEFDKNIELSKDDRICGKLHLEGTKEVSVDDKVLTGVLEKKHRDGEILDFEVTGNVVEIGVLWHLSPRNDFSTIRIEAEHIWWENLPGLVM